MINVGLINYTQFIAAAPGARLVNGNAGSVYLPYQPISMLLSVINNSMPVSKQSPGWEQGNTLAMSG